MTSVYASPKAFRRALTDKLKVLATGGNLHLYKVSSGCSAGGVKSGDATNFTGSYKFKPVTTITSP